MAGAGLVADAFCRLDTNLDANQQPDQHQKTSYEFSRTTIEDEPCFLPMLPRLQTIPKVAAPLP